jgi:YidC/Oxa1 family membrane protein insertase
VPLFRVPLSTTLNLLLELFRDARDIIFFRGKSERGPVEKRLEFQGNRYRIEVTVLAEGLTREDKLGITWEGGLADTENEGGISTGFYAGAYEQIVTYMGGEVELWDTDRLAEDETPPGGQLTWIGVRNKYFLAVLIPEDGRFDLALAGDIQVDPDGISYRDFSLAMVDDTGRDLLKYAAYIGPISYDVLRGQNRFFDGLVRELDLDEFVDYGPSFVRSILKPVTILILQAFRAMHTLVPNYGMVIILFSILVKIVVFPLTHKSLESTAKMQTLQPKIAELRERFGKDQKKLNEATMKLYKEEKINPIGGCLPMVLQMPILFSLFSLFRGTIELRQAGFVLWITDLSKPDTIPLGAFDFHVLPLLMGISMFIQQKMMMKDPKQAALVYIMPVFLTYIFWTMSSGLVFYYTLYNVLTLAQQLIMERTKRMLADS